MLVSICIPCYKSAKTLPVVVEGIRKEFAEREDDYEVVLVNDGSPDNTFEVIEQLCKEDSRITGIDLMRNYGQASAKLEALRHANGDIIIIMDDDGQHSPSDIFRLIEKMQSGDYDVVYAHLAHKKHTLMQRITSSVYNKLAVKTGMKPKGVRTSSFAAYSKAVIDKIKEYKSPFVSFGGYLRHITTKYADIDVEHHERVSGKSGYSFSKRMKMFKNIFFGFTMFPLRISTTIGEIMSAGGFAGIVYLIVRKILNPDIPAGYTSTNIILLLIGGMILIALGIIGEYIGRIYMTVSGMPQSTVRTIVGKEKNDAE